MAVKPVIVCLSRSGEDTAHKVATILGAVVHGRAGRVDRADAFFDNALDHVRALFVSGTRHFGACGCAAGFG